MSTNLQNCIEKLKIVSKIKDQTLRKKVLAEIADPCLYKALKEIAVNTVAKKVPLSKTTKNRLEKFEKQILDLTKNTNSSKQRKKLIVQAGGFLPILIPSILSVLTTLLKN